MSRKIYKNCSFIVYNKKAFVEIRELGIETNKIFFVKYTPKFYVTHPKVCINIIYQSDIWLYHRLLCPFYYHVLLGAVFPIFAPQNKVQF